MLPRMPAFPPSSLTALAIEPRQLYLEQAAAPVGQRSILATERRSARPVQVAHDASATGNGTPSP